MPSVFIDCRTFSVETETSSVCSLTLTVFLESDWLNRRNLSADSIYCLLNRVERMRLEAGVCSVCCCGTLCFSYLPRPLLPSLSLRYRVCDSVYSTLTNLQPKGFQSVFVAPWTDVWLGLATFVRVFLGAMLPSLDFVPCVFYCGPCEFAVGLPCVLYPSEIQHGYLLQCFAFVFAKL